VRSGNPAVKRLASAARFRAFSTTKAILRITNLIHLKTVLGFWVIA
jgi:hypothetical protein